MPSLGSVARAPKQQGTFKRSLPFHSCRHEVGPLQTFGAGTDARGVTKAERRGAGAQLVQHCIRANGSAWAWRNFVRRHTRRIFYMLLTGTGKAGSRRPVAAFSSGCIRLLAATVRPTAAVQIG